jgi:DNA-directed RNA polymerase specialized sigma24 family protein
MPDPKSTTRRFTRRRLECALQEGRRAEYEELKSLVEAAVTIIARSLLPGLLSELGDLRDEVVTKLHVRVASGRLVQDKAREPGPDDDVAAWVVACAKHHALSRVRQAVAIRLKQSNVAREVYGDDTPEDLDAIEELGERRQQLERQSDLDRAIDKLEKDDRDAYAAIALRFGLDAGYDEVARQMGLASGEAARTLTNRGLRALKRATSSQIRAIEGLHVVERGTCGG